MKRYSDGDGSCPVVRKFIHGCFESKFILAEQEFSSEIVM